MSREIAFWVAVGAVAMLLGAAIAVVAVLAPDTDQIITDIPLEPR